MWNYDTFTVNPTLYTLQHPDNSIIVTTHCYKKRLTKLDSENILSLDSVKFSSLKHGETEASYGNE